MNNLKCCALSPLLLACSAVSLAAAGTIEDNMETVVVTATGSDRSTLLAPASLSVISREDLQNVSDQKLLSALRKTAGISLSGRGVGGRKVIQLRGLESHHSLILVDGKRVSATDDVIGHSDFQYEWLPLDSIERIESALDSGSTSPDGTSGRLSPRAVTTSVRGTFCPRTRFL